jgi:hypothetical protein
MLVAATPNLSAQGYLSAALQERLTALHAESGAPGITAAVVLERSSSRTAPCWHSPRDGATRSLAEQ